MRATRAPQLLRLKVPRLYGHSGQDTQAYKSAETLTEERARDPLPALHTYLVPERMPESAWSRTRARGAARTSRPPSARALARPPPRAQELTRHVFSEPGSLQEQGGLRRRV